MFGKKRGRQGVKKDIHAAYDYYLEAARLGDSSGFTNIAWFYENGDLGEIDLEKAIEFYERAAEQDEENAIEALERLRGESGDA